MTNSISHDAESRREGSRQSDGRFGAQEHDEAAGGTSALRTHELQLADDLRESVKDFEDPRTTDVERETIFDFWKQNGIDNKFQASIRANELRRAAVKKRREEQKAGESSASVTFITKNAKGDGYKSPKTAQAAADRWASWAARNGLTCEVSITEQPEGWMITLTHPEGCSCRE